MKLKTKLYLGFGVNISLIALFTFLSWRALEFSKEQADHEERNQGYVQELLQREIDHLNWRTKLGKFQRDRSIKKIDVEKDPHKCGFGKWYYGEGRKKLEAEHPEVTKAIAEIEDAHRLLHESAQGIEDLLQKETEASFAEAVTFYDKKTFLI